MTDDLILDLRKQISHTLGLQALNGKLQIDEYDHPTEPTHGLISGGEDSGSPEMQCVRLMFRAVQRLQELHDLGETQSMVLEYEQWIVVRQMFAARARAILKPSEFARARRELYERYGIEHYDFNMYIKFPRRRGKSMAVAVALAVLLCTQIDMNILLINLSETLALQNMEYVLNVIAYLQYDPQTVIQCKFEGLQKRILTVMSHTGSVNRFIAAPNPDQNKGKSVRGLGSGGMQGKGGFIVIDEADFFKQDTLDTVQGSLLLNTPFCLISSQGNGESPARTMVNRRNERGRLIFRHYLILPGYPDIKISSDEPGTGPAFARVKQIAKRQPWWTAQPLAHSAAQAVEQLSAHELQRRTYLAMALLPKHQSVESFMRLKATMDTRAFRREVLNLVDDEEISASPAFPLTDLQVLASERSDFVVTTTDPPKWIVVVMDPAMGGKNSDAIILTVAYYAEKNDKSEQTFPSLLRMVLWGMDVLTKEEACDPEASARKVLEHVAAALKRVPGSKQAQVLVTIERNLVYVATEVRKAMEVEMSRYAQQSRSLLGEVKITIYHEQTRDGSRDPRVGICTTNAVKMTGVSRLRVRLMHGPTRICFARNFFTLTPNETPETLRKRILSEAEHFHVVPPPPGTRKRECEYTGKHHGGLDDTIMCLILADVSVCDFAGEINVEHVRGLA